MVDLVHTEVMVDMPMVPTLTPMVPTTLARGLLMLSLRLIPRLMLLSSMADTDMLLPMLVDMPMLTLATMVDMPMVPTLTPMVPTPLARGLLMLSLRPRLMLMLLSSTADTDMLLPMLVDMPMLTLDTVAMLDSPMPMVATLLMELTPTWE